MLGILAVQTQVVVSHCFNLHFPDTIFHGPSFICPLYIFFGEESLAKVLGSFFNWVVSFLISKSLCIL